MTASQLTDELCSVTWDQVRYVPNATADVLDYRALVASLEQLVVNDLVYRRTGCFARSSRKKGRLRIDSATEARELLEQGFTLQMRGLERVLNSTDSLIQFARSVELKCGRHLNSVSAFLTPAHSQGLQAHRDQTDIVTIQIAGSKTWTTGARSPLQSARDFIRSIHLCPGDVLLVPAGVWHSALAGEDDSLSVGLIFDQLGQPSTGP